MNPSVYRNQRATATATHTKLATINQDLDIGIFVYGIHQCTCPERGEEQSWDKRAAHGKLLIRKRRRGMYVRSEKYDGQQ